MNEAEKQKIISELSKFYKELRSYKNRQSRRHEPEFSETQIRSLDALRLKLQRDHGRLRDIISEYGGRAYLPILNRNYEVFSYSLGSLDIGFRELEALDAAISLVNKTIGKLQSSALSEGAATVTASAPPKAFIAHGGESPARKKLVNFLNALGITPIIVEEQPSEGRSKDKNVEYYLKQCDCAIILATKGDIDGKTGEFIPRGNILNEIGRAQGILPDKMIYLLEKETKFPTNIDEKVWERFTQESMDKAFIKIAKELRAFELIKAV